MSEETFLQLISDHLSDQLWLQSLLVAVFTCHVEDPARCGVALLVSGGHMGWWTAFIGMVIGGVYGDIGLYLTGRYAMHFLVKRRWFDPARLTRMEAYFHNHAAWTVLIARFLPGIRGVAYVAAGVARYPIPRFLALLVTAATLQALLFLWLGDFIGDRILPLLKDRGDRLALIGAVVLAGVLGHWLFARRREKKRKAAAAATSPQEP